MPTATLRTISPEVSQPFELSSAESVQEKYAHSNSAFIAFGGQQALKNEVSLESPEALAVKTDFMNAVAEMLSTDSDFKDRLHIEETKTYKVKDSTIHAEDGRDVVELVSGGAKASAKEAENHKEYESLAIRDTGDEKVAKIAANLLPGQTHITASLAPLEALEQFPQFYKQLGFNDVTYLQYFAMNHNSTLEAGFFSVKNTDLQAWINVMKQRGAEIPDDVDCNTFITHGQTLDMDADEALQEIKQIRQEFYDEIGADYSNAMSVNEFVAQNSHIIDAIFAKYYPALSMASATQRNNAVLQNYARELLAAKDMPKFKEDIRRNLIKIANTQSFDGDLAQTMDMVFRYGAVEALRAELPKFLNHNKLVRIAGVALISISTGHEASIDFVNLNQYMISYTREGVRNNREYGGCPGNSSMTEQSDAFSSTSTLNQTMNYGGSFGRFGRMGRERWKTRKGKCVVNSCPSRPKEVTIGPCGVCMDRCQKLFDKGVDPAKTSSTKKAKVSYEQTK